MLNPILTATKITNKEVIKANIFDESSFKFIKFPICPPISTAINNNKKSLKRNILIKKVKKLKKIGEI